MRLSWAGGAGVVVLGVAVGFDLDDLAGVGVEEGLPGQDAEAGAELGVGGAGQGDAGCGVGGFGQAGAVEAAIGWAVAASRSLRVHAERGDGDLGHTLVTRPGGHWHITPPRPPHAARRRGSNVRVRSR